MSFITEMEGMGDMKIENKGDLRNVMQSARRRSSPALTIPQTERWIQDTQVEGNINYLSNPDATKDVNEVRTRKETEKELAYSLEILFDRWKMLLLRLQRKSENIKNVIENKFNVRAVSEGLKQYDDLLTLFSGVQGEYHRKLDDDQQKADDFWFDEVDQKIFTFKHSAHNYLRENEEVMSRRSGSSRKTKSSSSSSSSKSRKSGKSIEEQVVNEKMKLAEIEALASFRKQQKTNKLAVEEMKLEEELVKAKAGVKVTEAQGELEKGKTLDSGLNSGSQIGFTENLSFYP